MARKKMTVQQVVKETLKPTSIENSRKAFSRWQRMTREERLKFNELYYSKTDGRLR